MYLKYIQHPSGKRVYTIQSHVDGKVSRSAHPPRFSPEDKHAAYRIKMRKRYKPLFDLYKKAGSDYAKFKELLDEALAQNGASH